ncbi:MAG: ATP-binding cassette domain-containing protein [Ignisphaera sp.]
MKCIDVIDIKKKYIAKEGLRKNKVVEALNSVTFHVDKGTIHALLGPNGAGKTTMIKILATLLLPDEGIAKVLGFDVVKEADEVRRRIGVVLDVAKGFYSSLSGYENLVFYGLLKGLSFSYARRRTREVLELVGLEAMDASKRSYHTYSLGMRARLAMAKALLTEPELLLLDEPTLGLDVESARTVRKLMVELAKEGRTILVTGHNMFEIEQIADRITIIDKGRVIANGAPQELKDRVGLIHKITLSISGDTSKFLSVIGDKLGIEKLRINDFGENKVVIAYVKAKRGDIVQSIFDVMKSMDIKILDLSIVEPTLEDVYIAIVRGDSNDL